MASQPPNAHYSEVPTSPGLGGPDHGSPILPSDPAHSSNRYSDMPTMPSEQSHPGFAPSINRDSSYASSLAAEGGMAAGGGLGDKRGSYSSNMSDMPMNQTPGYTRSTSTPLGMTSSPLAAGALAADYPEAGAPSALGSRQPKRGRLEVLGAGETLGWNAGQGTEKPRWWNSEKAAAGGAGPYKERNGRGRRFWFIVGGVILTLALVGAGVGLGVHFANKSSSRNNAVTSPDNADASTSGTSGSSGTGTRSSSPTASATPTATSGGDGSTILFEDGTKHTYANRFGGLWAADASRPYLNDARPNSWTPPLNQSWDWSRNIRGVNLGGWLQLEPFISPAPFEKYATGPAGTTIDEYTLSINMGTNLQAELTNHYDTFITEQDFMEIADAGLDWVRLPIPYWAIETYEQNDEPFLPKIAWPYVIKAFKLARKYGLRVNLDLHSLPGSQNGWNHSGRLGQVNWLNGVMGLANAQRSLDYILALAEFISQPEWTDVVPMFGVYNEPLGSAIGQQNLGAFNLHLHNKIRDITGRGAGKGPYISLHEGFLGISSWYSYGQGLDRVAYDVHQYTVFQDQDLSSPAVLAAKPCEWWAGSSNVTKNTLGVSNAGEWSASSNDCGLNLNGVSQGQRYDGTFAGYTGPTAGAGACAIWDNADLWTPAMIANTRALTLASMDGLGSYFFWTWKIGNSTALGHASCPAWHYKMGLEKGYIPRDPREAVGYCVNSAGIAPTPFTAYPAPYATGGAGAGTPAAALSASYPWPITTMSPSFGVADMTRLPQYTATSSMASLTGMAVTGLAASATPTGTRPAAATAQVYAPVAGCVYPDIYSAANLAIPASACGAGPLTQKLKRDAQPTPPPTQ